MVRLPVKSQKKEGTLSAAALLGVLLQPVSIMTHDQVACDLSIEIKVAGSSCPGITPPAAPQTYIAQPLAMDEIRSRARFEEFISKELTPQWTTVPIAQYVISDIAKSIRVTLGNNVAVSCLPYVTGKWFHITPAPTAMIKLIAMEPIKVWSRPAQVQINGSLDAVESQQPSNEGITAACYAVRGDGALELMRWPRCVRSGGVVYSSAGEVMAAC